MLSGSGTRAFKIAFEDPQKILWKSTKTWNCLAYLAISEALTIHPTNFFKQLFNSPFFLSLIYMSVTRHPVVWKHEKIRPVRLSVRLFVRVFTFEVPFKWVFFTHFPKPDVQ